MNVTSFLYDTGYNPSAPVLTMRLSARRELELTALIDSGADATMIPINFLHQIGAEYVRTQRMRGITEASRRVNLYSVVLQISIHRLPSIRVVGSAAGTEVILGRDVLNHLIITLNGLAGVTEIEI